jgi:predicted ATP-binding protein involved in virulence
MNDTPETEKLNGRLDYSLVDAYLLMTQHARKLEIERNELRAGLRTMISAATDVVERWETPLWKDAKPTATFIHALRDAVDKVKGVMP